MPFKQAGSGIGVRATGGSSLVRASSTLALCTSLRNKRSKRVKDHRRSRHSRGHKILDQAEKKYQEALKKWGPDQEVGFPNTGYYLPVIYGILGIPVKKLGDMKQVFERCRSLIPPARSRKRPGSRILRRPWTRAWRPFLPRRSSRPSAT